MMDDFSSFLAAPEKKEQPKEEPIVTKEEKKKMTTSKKLIWFLFINCTIIELVVIFVTFKSFSLAEIICTMPDFTPLVTLVGAVVAEVIGYAVYAVKSAKENSIGGITYEMAMKKEETKTQQGE